MLTLHNILASNPNLPQGQLQKAIAASQQAINRDSGNANVHFNLAIGLAPTRSKTRVLGIGGRG
ncbi:hypothetical protein [Nostoc sp. WHI]|uniref:hypothetical protein n=1 Tax=Nostoc sp. WHI TaxID=2650611 RepID=UPI0018C5CEB1|nr:hypothetical protein [Nostoc sp. WHI]MBG1271100.1 hypothetical protein [Nostoc sp. WHI]